MITFEATTLQILDRHVESYKNRPLHDIKGEENRRGTEILTYRRTVGDSFRSCTTLQILDRHDVLQEQTSG